MSVHDGHRARVRQRVLEEGVAHLPAHNVLEILLFFSRPRGDTNELAHRILDRFHGDIAAVFEASYEELLAIEGVGENTAFLLKLIPQVTSYYRSARVKEGLGLTSLETMREYFIPIFYGKHNEELHLISLDAAMRPISDTLISEGSVSASAVNVKRIVEAAIGSHAARVMLAHNHPSGVPRPSQRDEEATRAVQAALALVDIPLEDHIIVAEENLCSFRYNGILPYSGR